MTNQLANIKNFDQLICYLEDELDWPCQQYGFEEITFKYTPEELGIKEEDSVQIRQIHQLRPFYQGQPWGIFFIEFEKQRLPVALLRRILSHLVVKKRASANSADKAVWNMDNLLFISAFGDASTETREIAFAHFHQEDGDLPTLKVLGWDGADTVLKMEFVDQELHEKLHWPKDPKNVEAWQSTWTSAFRHKPGFVIKTANALADRLAELARGIRGAAETLMAHETEKGPLRQLYKAFQTALIHDLTEADFADTYAQTITYGLLTAAISRTDMRGGIYGTALVASNVTDLVPITNPFLKEMLETFIHAGDRKGGIQFDELGIQDVVDLLRGEETDLPAVLRDFDNKTPGEDPVIQFYEHFLSAYNKKLKIQRGVFYTPKPVVSYIVRSVHELLKTEFGLEDGLADTTTWGEMEKKIPGLKCPESTDPDSPFVMILDPATGTATFLVEVIDVIFKTLTDKWEKKHINKSAQIEAWNEYVPKHLLPRLFGFELMMAPYAIAHMKIGLKLFETGYRFGSTERVRVFLTNSLEPASDIKIQQTFAEMASALAHEANAVNSIKINKIFSVIIGNPPYSIQSANLDKSARNLINVYKYVDGERIRERNSLQFEKNLQDDYIKFIRFGEICINFSKIGIIGFITNDSFLDSRSFRGMRQHLLSSFSRINILDLHGSQKKKEVDDLGYRDENVFDIQQGVSISLFRANNFQNMPQVVERADLLGPRKYKYEFLKDSKLSGTNFQILIPTGPFYQFTKINKEIETEYLAMPSIKEIIIKFSSGIKTHKDNFAYSFTEKEMERKVNQFLDPRTSEDLIRKNNSLKDTPLWKLSVAREKIRIKGGKVPIVKALYRPFDIRFLAYSNDIVRYTAQQITNNLDGQTNLALLVSQQQIVEGFSHAFITRIPADWGSVSNKSRESTSIFPLFLRINNPDGGFPDIFAESKFSSNISLKFINIFSKKLGSDQLLPEQIFNYVYAILYSTSFRLRYVSLLKSDFPHIPYTSDRVLFSNLVILGKELEELHLMEAKILDSPQIIYFGSINPEIENVSYENETIWINRLYTNGFQKVPQEVWNFTIGSYQICEKWLKDRRGRQLSEYDITHYQKIVIALKETIRIMGEIDQVIEDHGGWPIK